MTKFRTKLVLLAMLTALLLGPSGIMGSSVAEAACATTQSSNSYSNASLAYYSYLAKVGGVSLDKAATFLADMSDVKGAYFDQTSNRIVFTGPKLGVGQTPIFNKDDLAVAIKAVIFNNTLPEVDIQNVSNPSSNTWPVTFFGGIENTNFGYVLEKADYSLKQYSFGYLQNGQPVTSSVPGYASFASRFLAMNPSINDSAGAGRIWISPQLVSLKKDDSTSSFVFDQVKMQVQGQYAQGSSAKFIQANNDFAQHMTTNFDAFANENQWFSKTKDLAKIVSVVKWLKDNNIVTDYQWAQQYTPAYVQTPTSEPAYNSPTITQNNIQWTFHGGIQYDTANTYSAANGQASSLKTSSESAAPSTVADHWTYAQGSQTYESVAVSANAFRSTGTYSTQTTDFDIKTRGDLHLSFKRTYNSLGTTSKEIGAGWEYMPARLQNLQPGINISDAPSGGYSGLYPKKLAYQTEDGGYETYTYTAGTGYLADKSNYHSKLSRNTDGSYSVLQKDLFTNKFDVGLNLIIRRDKNNNSIYYHYDSNARISSVDDDWSRALTINRNTQGVITSVVDWAGRTVSYGYDSNGNLSTVTDPRGNIITYGYDARGRLTTMTNRQGQIILSNTYNDDSKVVSSTNAAGLTTNFVYDETAKLVTATDNNARVTKTYYDDQSRVLKQVDPLNNYVQMTYGNEPTPLTVRDKNNHSTTYVYDTYGNATSVTYPDGKQVTKQYNGQNLVTQVSDNRYGLSPKITTYTYDANSNLLNTNEAGVVREYTYDSAGHMVTSKDGRSGITSYTVNTLGEKLTETSPTGSVTTYAYDSIGRMTQITDASSNVKAYTYDANNNVVTANEGSGTVTNTYSADNQLTKAVAPDNKTVEFSYNLSGEQSQTKDPLTNLTSYGYDQYSDLTSRQDALNHTTVDAYDAIQRKTQSTTPLGKVAKWEYDAKGNLTKRTDESNRVTTYEYNNMDRLTKTTYPDASIITYSYDDRGNLTGATSPTGTSTYTYDVFDRLTSEQDPHSSTVSYVYDNANNLTQVTYPGSKTVGYLYDSSNRLKTVTDWNTKQTMYSYNSNGTISRERLPNNIVAAYQYDAANRVSSVAYTLDSKLITKFSYTRDANGNVTQETESKPTTTPTSYTLYDEAVKSGWLTSWSWSSTINVSDTASPLEGTKAIAWTPTGAYAGLNIHINTGTFSTTGYNALTFSIKATQSNEKVALGIEDTNNNELVDPIDVSVYGGAISSTGYKTYVVPLSAFNAVNAQIKGITLIENTGGAQPKMYVDNVKFTNDTPSPATIYDDAPTSFFENWSWDGTYDFSDTSDPFNGLKAIGASFTSGYSGMSLNDARGFSTAGYGALSLAVKSGSANQATVVRLTDANGNGIGNTKSLSDYGGYPTNTGYTVYEIPLTDLAVANTVIHGIDVQNDTGLSPKQLKIDDIKLLPTQAATLVNQNTNFGYDLDGRLTSATYPSRTYTYTYDAVGNRLTSNENGTSSTYTLNNDNQTLSKSSRAFTYDNQGNQITDGTKSLTYDYDNRLKSWLDPGTSTTISYKYDANGNRIEKNINGVHTYDYVNDNTSQLSKLLIANNVPASTQQYYVYGSGLLSQGASGASDRQYYLSDGVGNVRYVTNSSSSTIQSYTYDPYGNEVTTGSTSNFTFQGQQKDREDNLTYLRARYYDPTTGRFISRDPIVGTLGNPQTQNGYSYANNDPIDLSDPSGKFIQVGLLLLLGGASLGALLSGPDISQGIQTCNYGQVAWGVAGLIPEGRIAGVARAIATGHAADRLFEFSSIGVRTEEQLTKHVADVMTNPTAAKVYAGGQRTAYLSESSRTIVVIDPFSMDYGTVIIKDTRAAALKYYMDLH